MRALLTVCDLVPKKFGSFERFLVGMASACARRGVRLGLVLAGEPVPSVADAFREHAIQWWVVPDLRSDSTWRRRVAFVRDVVRVMTAAPWDVVSFNFCNEFNVACACAAARAASRRDFHAVWEQHSEIRLPFGYRKHFSRLRLLSPFVSAFIGLSQPAVRSISERLGSGAKVYRIYNGVSFGEHRRGWLRQELGLASSATLLVNVGGLIPLKAQDVLIDAAAPLLRGAADTHLLIVGGGPLRESLEARAQAAGVRQRVHFLGIRNDVPDLLADCDLFVLPSRTEALPYSVIEAMSVGLPVVASDVGGIGDLVSHNQTGLLVPPNDVAGLNAALHTLLKDRDLARQFGRAGYAKAYQCFNLDRSIEQRLDLYDRLTGQPRRADDLRHRALASPPAATVITAGAMN